jgi:hypothetical protein
VHRKAEYIGRASAPSTRASPQTRRVKEDPRVTLSEREGGRGGTAKEELVAKGISERFDEEERDTTRRDYSRDVLDQAKKTAHHRIVKLEEPRTESGTRAAISRSAIAAHVESKALVDLAPSPEDEDEARPTVVAGVERLQLPLEGISDIDDIPVHADFTPEAGPSAGQNAQKPTETVRPIFVLVIVALALFAAALGGVGFMLGRMSIPH